jgi:hypothetical protein
MFDYESGLDGLSEEKQKVYDEIRNGKKSN